MEPSEMLVCTVCEYTGVWSTCTYVGYMSVCEKRGVPEYMGVCLQKLEVYARYTPSSLPPPFLFLLCQLHVGLDGVPSNPWDSHLSAHFYVGAGI